MSATRYVLVKINNLTTELNELNSKLNCQTKTKKKKKQ